MDWLEWTGVLLGVVYLWLEYRASIWLWLPSVAMPAVYLGVYWEAGLYADFAVNVYYLLASLYGLACWLYAARRHNAARDAEGVHDHSPSAAAVRHVPPRLWWRIAAVTVLLFAAIGTALRCFTDSTVPWADAFTTALSVTALWMLARRYVEQWLVWIAADVACSALYVYKELIPTALLYAAYAAVAVAGYYKWRRLAGAHH